ncbi:MAG: hypothetical protein RBQ64_05185 [Candidatus Izemoplasmatales bacterium]|jgi:hypothetical protein|nr:hypothetical protein [Candidatus Izemoplasmatales bacterium]HPE00292.1 hypothetical protein [Bacillota bacterium]
MKKFKKPLKFYLILFLILSFAVMGYSIYKIVYDSTPVEEVMSLWFLPLIFILIYYGSDSLMEKLFNKKKQVNYEEKFIEEIAKKMREDNAFLIEEYRRLQINEKFQESLKIGYEIYINGESDQFNNNKLERKFKKGTIEHKAVQYVIDYIRETQKPVE